MDLRLAHPWFLLLLLALPLVAWVRRRHLGRPAFLYSSVALVRGITVVDRSPFYRLMRKMRWVALTLLIVGMARPQMGAGRATVKSAGIDIVVALDLSTSMASEDFELEGKRINRLEIAKRVLREFIEKRPNDRIGLVAFARNAYVVAPPTLDHDFLIANLRRLEMGLIEDGTAVGSALSAALNRLRNLGGRSRIVILMTDGQNNAGKVPPLTAAEAAHTLGIKVYTIGVGTRGRAPVPVTDAFGIKRYRMIEVDIDEDTLQKIAERTGGRYFRADNTQALRRIYEEIDRMEKTEVEMKEYRRYRELFHWAVLPAMVLLLIEVILNNTLWRRLP
ncbi:MAG: VWA domain-containing protein [Verrucomicrobia bacterium]|nr:MAG: VWA domain-containing protein [Verrucomicrobiota bacterium]